MTILLFNWNWHSFGQLLAHLVFSVLAIFCGNCARSSVTFCVVGSLALVLWSIIRTTIAFIVGFITSISSFAFRITIAFILRLIISII